MNMPAHVHVHVHVHALPGFPGSVQVRPYTKHLYGEIQGQLHGALIQMRMQ
jgi:hypothetical protein